MFWNSLSLKVWYFKKSILSLLNGMLFRYLSSTWMWMWYHGGRLSSRKLYSQYLDTGDRCPYYPRHAPQSPTMTRFPLEKHISHAPPCNLTLHFLHLFITPLLFVPYHVLSFHSSAVSFIKRIGFNCNTESRTLTNRLWRCSDYEIIQKQADSCWGFP